MMSIVLNKPKAIYTASAANGGGVVINLPPVQDVVESELKQLADSIRQRMVRSIVETGRDLQKAKAKLPHGQFGNWLKTEFDMSPKTAENYMRAAELADTKSEIVSFLPAAVLYKLAAPSTPAAVPRPWRKKTPKSRPVSSLVSSRKKSQKSRKTRTFMTQRSRRQTPRAKRSWISSKSL